MSFIPHEIGKQNIIILDIDDTLHFFNEQIREVAHSKGFFYKEEDVTEWSVLVELCGGHESFLEILYESYAKNEFRLMPGALEACQQLDSLGFELHYFTDRPKGLEAATVEWMINAGFPQPENIHICHDKRAEIVKLNRERLAAMIDDRPRTLVWAKHVLNIPHVLSVRHPWNQALFDVTGIWIANDWVELQDYINKKVLEPLLRD